VERKRPLFREISKGKSSCREGNEEIWEGERGNKAGNWTKGSPCPEGYCSFTEAGAAGKRKRKISKKGFERGKDFIGAQERWRGEWVSGGGGGNSERSQLEF